MLETIETKAPVSELDSQCCTLIEEVCQKKKVDKNRQPYTYLKVVDECCSHLEICPTAFIKKHKIKKKRTPDETNQAMKDCIADIEKAPQIKPMRVTRIAKRYDLDAVLVAKELNVIQLDRKCCAFIEEVCQQKNVDNNRQPYTYLKVVDECCSHLNICPTAFILRHKIKQKRTLSEASQAIEDCIIEIEETANGKHHSELEAIITAKAEKYDLRPDYICKIVKGNPYLPSTHEFNKTVEL